MKRPVHPDPTTCEVIDDGGGHELRQVQIGDGWLIREFAKHILGVHAPVNTLMYSITVPSEVDDFMDPPRHIQLTNAFAEALIRYDKLVAQKNAQYKDAWQKDGPVTALTDLKDKMYRLDAATEMGVFIAWDYDKLLGTLFDILIRDLMLLSWFGLNFTDDDDDRNSRSKQVS